MNFRNLNSISLKCFHEAQISEQISESSGYMQCPTAGRRYPRDYKMLHATVARAVESASRLKMLLTRQPPPLANDRNGYPFDGHISKGFTYPKIEIARMDTQKWFEFLGCSLNHGGPGWIHFGCFGVEGYMCLGLFCIPQTPARRYSKVLPPLTIYHSRPYQISWGYANPT